MKNEFGSETNRGNDPFSVETLERTASVLRATCIQMAYNGREGHLSSALSCIDILTALYYSWLRLSPESPRDPERDRLIFSKGHAATALYSVLCDRGFLSLEELRSYAQTDSALPNHPCKHALPLLELSTGSLGHGLGVATGMLIGFRLDGHTERRAAVVLSDGECNEGSVWESAMFAAAHGLDRLMVIVDNNNVQAVGRTDALTGHMEIADKFASFGWASRTIDGNNIGELLDTLAQVPFEPGNPSAIVAKTVAGSGVSFMEDDQVWHYRVPKAEEVKRAFEELGVEEALVERI